MVRLEIPDVQYSDHVLRFEGSLQAMEGILSVRRDTPSDTKDEEAAQYTFNCESKFKTKLPYSVIIYKDKGKTE